MDVDWQFWNYYVWATLLVVSCTAAWLLNLVALPGNWIMIGAAVLFTALMPLAEGRGVTWKMIIVLAILAVAGEIIEFAAGAAGAAKQGASRRAIALSMFGAIIGSIFGVSAGSAIFPVIGSLIGAVLGGAAGAFAGAYLGEAWKGRDEPARTAAGRGAFFGRIWGTVGKVAVGAVMLAVIAWDAFF
jgi:uncharacterized protein YqgC (DUF456 family)